MTAQLQMTGAWFGRFAYRDGVTPPVHFIAALVEDDGSLSGETSEPNSIGDSSDYLRAVLSGERSGRAVAFTKLYDGESDAAHAVRYEGTLDDAGELLEGEWALAGSTGPFRMTRSHAEDEMHASSILENTLDER